MDREVTEMMTALERVMGTLGKQGAASLRTMVAAALGSLLVGAAGCTLVVDAEKVQCKTDLDCVDQFGAEDLWVCRANVCESQGMVSVEPPEWACLDETPMTMSMPGPFAVKMHLQSLVKATVPQTDVRVRVCRKLDVDCMDPESETTSDQSGDVTLSIPAGFTGYVELYREDLMKTLYFFNPPIDRDTTIASVQLAPLIVAQGLTERAGAPLQAGRGLILLGVYACDGMTAGGIAFSSPQADPSTQPFYAPDGAPTVDATATDRTGFGGFINAPDGFFTIEGTRTSDSRVIGRVGVQAKPSHLTITRLVAGRL